MAVWNIGMYSKSITESSKTVLIEALRILGSYRDYLVLTGGWAPYFILEKFGEGGQHCGSIDIDFVLNPRLIVWCSVLNLESTQITKRSQENISTCDV